MVISAEPLNEVPLIVLAVAKLTTLTIPLPSIANPVPIFIPPKTEAVEIGKVRKLDLFNHAVPSQ